MNAYKTLPGAVLLAIFLLAVQSAHAQERRLGAGLHAGVTIALTDVKKNDFAPSFRNPNEIRTCIGLQGVYSLNPYLNLRFNWLIARLAGGRPARDDEFTARLNDVSLQLMINMSSIFFYDEEDALIDIYGIIGCGLTSFRSVRRTTSTGEVLNTYGYERDGTTRTSATSELVIPVGIGLRSMVSDLFPSLYNTSWDNMELGFDAMLHMVNTDKLDASLETTRGRDRFTYFSLGLVYYIR